MNDKATALIVHLLKDYLRLHVRGIGSKDCSFRTGGLTLIENLVLDILSLKGGFDHKVSVGDFPIVGGK